MHSHLMTSYVLIMDRGMCAFFQFKSCIAEVVRKGVRLMFLVLWELPVKDFQRSTVQIALTLVISSSTIEVVTFFVMP